MPNGVPPHFLVVIPGLMGCKLREKEPPQRVVWGDFFNLPQLGADVFDWLTRFVQDLTFTSGRLEPCAVMDEVVFLPPFFKLEAYGRLTRHLENWGYDVDPAAPSADILTAHTFYYDWRDDNRKSAEQLAEKIEQWKRQHPGCKAWIIAHSNGGLVARWYTLKLGGAENVGRLILLAAPWDGVPLAVQFLFEGANLFPFPQFDGLNLTQLTRDVIRTFASFYQLIPSQTPALLDADTSEAIDPFADSTWLPEGAPRALLASGKEFSDALKFQTGVEDTLCIYGDTRATTTVLKIKRANGRWVSVTPLKTEMGDDTVPLHSAVYPVAQRVMTTGDHGNLYADLFVVMKLKWELVDKYRRVYAPLMERISRFVDTPFAAVRPALVIDFRVARDVYAPGDKIAVRVELSAPTDARDKTFGGGQIELVWRRQLPGERRADEVPAVRQSVELARAEFPAVYRVEFTAPPREGLYEIRARVNNPRGPFAQASNPRQMIAVRIPALTPALSQKERE
jgi:pimeloyl-ACP methyl ester carboxylesterase